MRDGTHEKVWEDRLGERHGFPVRAYARVCLWPEPLGWVLTDMEVPPQARGNGHARGLMAQVTEWADANGHDLCLSLAPGSGLSPDDLEAWYLRCGFEWVDGILRRSAR